MRSKKVSVALVVITLAAVVYSCVAYDSVRDSLGAAIALLAGVVLFCCVLYLLSALLWRTLDAFVDVYTMLRDYAIRCWRSGL